MHKALIFAAGALIGALGGVFTTRAILIKKFNNDLNEVREYYKSKKPEEQKNEKESEKTENNHVFQKSSIDLDRYKSKVAWYENKVEEPSKNESMDLGKPTMPTNEEGPITITPKDFYAGEEDGVYETTELIFYEDDEVLADNNDEIVARSVEIDDMLGTGNIDKYGEYEADTLFVRLPKLPNEDKGTQYIISVIHDSYEKITGIPIEES